MNIQRNGFFLVFATALTESGKPASYVLVIFSLIAFGVPQAWTIAAILVASELTAETMKRIIRRPRPKGKALIPIEGKYSMPSAHTQNAMSVWGYIALQSADLRIQILCGVVVLSVSWSRIFIGHHYYSDVLVGIIVGAAIASIFFVVL